MILPAPPADGGFIVLTDKHLDSLDLLCAIKRAYPRTRIYAQRSLSREARRVMSIGNVPQPTGMVGYLARNEPTGRALRAAMDKIKSSTS